MSFDLRARRGAPSRATSPEPGGRRPLLRAVIAVTGAALGTLLALAVHPGDLIAAGIFALAGATVALLAARFRTPGALDPDAAMGLAARSREAELMVEQVREYAILGIDPEGRITSWNEGAVQVLGYEPAELLGLPADRLFPPEDQAAGLGARELATAAREGSASDDRWLLRKDGTRFFALGRTTAVRDARGRLLGFTKVLQDHTALKRAEQAVARSRAELQQLLERVPAIVGVVRVPDRTYLLANAALRRLFGERGLVGRAVPEIHPELATQGFLELVERVAATGERFVGSEMPVWLDRAGDGRLARGYFDFVLEPMHDPEGGVTAVLIFAIEITAEVEAREALRLNEQRLRTAVKTAGLIVFNQDRDLRYTWIQNPPLGLAAEQFIGRRDREIFPDPEAAARLEAFKTRVLETGTGGREEIALRLDGETLLLDVVAEPLRDESGAIAGITCSALDVTARRRAEAQLREAQRIEAVGRLAGGVAHEINNMMTAVIGFGQFVAAALGLEHPQAGDVAEMVRAAERAAGISRQLLAFSRQQVLQPTVLDLNEVVADFRRMLQRVLGVEYPLELRLAPDLGRVRADRVQVEQVLVNLLLNARDALSAKAGGAGAGAPAGAGAGGPAPGGGEAGAGTAGAGAGGSGASGGGGSGGGVVIETANTRLGEAERRRYPQIALREGEYVALTVRDSGVGMSPEVQSRAFEPFFTTKAVGKGTGLGLSTVYGIVKQSEGYVFIESDPAWGTAVRVYLPRVDVGEAAQAPEPARPSGREAELVVVAEDEEMLRRLTCRALAAGGYRVLEAADGQEALALVDARAGAVDLVLTDVLMPEMGGDELGRRLAEQYPDLPVVYMSGYTAREMARRGMLAPGAPVLTKPFTPSEVLERVREVLDRVPRNR